MKQCMVTGGTFAAASVRRDPLLNASAAGIAMIAFMQGTTPEAIRASMKKEEDQGTAPARQSE